MEQTAPIDSTLSTATPSIDKNFWYALLILAISIPVIEKVTPTPQDVSTMFNWFTMAHERGLWNVYAWDQNEVTQRFNDFAPNYPPLLFYICYPLFLLASKLGSPLAFPSVAANLIVRAPIYLFQIFLAALGVRWALSRSFENPSRAWVLLMINPALLLGGALWGQWDVALTALVFASLFAFSEEEPFWSALFLALAALFKPQFVLLLPLFIAEVLRSRNVKMGGIVACLALALFLLLPLPFTLASGFSWFTAGYQRALQGEFQLTVTAYNAWWIVGKLTSISNIHHTILGIPAKLFGLGFSAILFLPLFVHFVFKGKRESLIPLGAIFLVGCYCFLPGMTSRFLSMGLVWTLLWALQDRKILPLAYLLTALEISSLLYRAMWDTGSRFSAMGLQSAAGPIAMTSSLLLIATFILMYRGYWNQFVGHS